MSKTENRESKLENLQSLSKIENRNSKIFSDHFSGHAADYAKFRPHYPEKLFRFLASLTSERKLAWDCATGNGQAAVALADFFEGVIATDASKEQIANAHPHPRVDYRVAPAENSGIDSHTIDLITVAQALHWFDLNRFYAEARRVLKPNGVIAASAYNLLSIAPAIDAIINHYYSDVVGPYWPPERILVEKFNKLEFPFPEINAPSFAMVAHWNLEQLLGYLRTWSATQRFIAANTQDPIEAISQNLRSAWGDGEELRLVTWPLTLRVART
jgi:SAM-dependent methyltransferase